MAATDVSLTHYTYELSTSECKWVAYSKPRIPLDTLILAVSALLLLSLNCAAYMDATCACCGCASSREAPDAVNRRAHRQAIRYCLVALFTWLPYWLLVLLGRKPTIDYIGNFWQTVSSCVIQLNGALNMWVYALHNRHVKRTLRNVDLGAPAPGGTVT